MRRMVLLYDMVGVSAIVLERSGAVYRNQTCGTACLQSEAEGILVPLNNDPPLDQPELSFESQLSTLLRDVCRLDGGLADRIDDILASYPPTTNVRTDRQILLNSHEAWVYVEISESPDSVLQGFGDCKAVLTWPNSD